MRDPSWLRIARELQAIAQTGLAFTKDPFDRERFERIQELAAAMMAEGAGHPADRILQLFQQDVGYPTPKIDVRGAVFQDDKILLVREASDGLWTLPGGWADVNQSAAESVEREIEEESGYRARAKKLAALWERSRQGHPHHPASIYKLFFICELTGGNPKPSVETTAVDFFSLDALPALSTGRTLASQIHRMLEHVKHPDLPTDFD
jgi:ADP-ribose pyrophosphatase YjhB (NUDIX family)